MISMQFRCKTARDVQKFDAIYARRIKKYRRDLMKINFHSAPPNSLVK